MTLFARWIYALARVAVSQEALAMMLGVTRQTLSKELEVRDVGLRSSALYAVTVQISLRVQIHQEVRDLPSPNLLFPNCDPLAAHLPKSQAMVQEGNDLLCASLNQQFLCQSHRWPK